MSKVVKFANFDSFQPVENMDPVVRSQQYAFNGRIFLPPQTDMFTVSNTIGDNIVPRIDARYQYNGGLIDPLMQDETVKPYELYRDSTKPQETNVSIISNIAVPNKLSRTFFSNDNIERIQRQIVQGVFDETQKKISKQSYQELQVIMKSIYLQYGKNLPYDIEKQVVTLNKYVADECIRIITPNLLQYNKYIEDITSPIPIMPRSQNVSNKGYKTYDFSSLIPTTVNTI
jgi:hypothetical protein